MVLNHQFTNKEDLLGEYEVVKTKEGKDTIYYYNIASGFDIETSSFYLNEEKHAIMYLWGFGVNGNVVIGRTWKEFKELLNYIVENLHLDTKHRLIVYVHNLSYEFQFIRKHFEWDSVFALEERKVCKALTKDGIEFRCSYILSGNSLNNVGKNLTKYKVNKLVGTLDYSLLRHSETPLSDTEIQYLVNDVLVVMAYIQEKIEIDGNITKIPLTKTSYVRKYCRNKCYYENSKNHKKGTSKYTAYRTLMNNLKIVSELEWQQLQRAFQGGFTHASGLKSGSVIDNVTSYDFTSSYPSVLVSEKFPMSKGQLVTIKSKEEFERYITHYCCLFEIAIYGLDTKDFIEHPLSESKCYYKENVITDNGRIVSADLVITTITEQDYFILKDFYSWKKVKIRNFRYYLKGYLPTELVKSVLELYRDKTTLKGVEGREIDYMLSKENINSVYGMMVTNICRDEIKYENDKWIQTPCNVKDILEKDNQSKKRFLFYPWGVWITAYARRNLFTGIKECGDDYCYADTDSIKIKNAEKHLDYIKRYNDLQIKKLKKAIEYHKLDFELCSPKNIKGEILPLGLWCFDGFYKKFKTLGAKRYLVQYEDNHYSMTISGLNKSVAMPYLESKGNPFELFNLGMFIDKDNTGKQIHTYIDIEQEGYVYDYKGVKAYFKELSSIHLEGCEFTLDMSKNYLNYLCGIKERLIGIYE